MVHVINHQHLRRTLLRFQPEPKLFLQRLENAIETRSQELIAAVTGEPVRPSLLVPAPDELARAAMRPSPSAEEGVSEADG